MIEQLSELAAEFNPDECEFDEIDQSQIERDLRRRILKGVKIRFEGSSVVVDGIVRNISDGGALIMLLDFLLVPDEIVIHNELDGYRVAAEVVRRKSNQIAVRFAGEFEQVGKTRTQVVTVLDMAEKGASADTVETPSVITQAKKSPRTFGKRGR